MAAGQRVDDHTRRAARPVRDWLCLGMLLAVPLHSWLVHAGQPEGKIVEPADADLIEFLGTVDSDDVAWKQYLARIAARSSAPAPASSAPAKEGAKDEH